MKKQNFFGSKWTIIVLILLLSVLTLSLLVGCQKESTTTKQQDEQSQTEKSQDKDYVVVDTGQDKCYDNEKEIDFPKEGEAFHGQDAQHQGNQPSYTVSADKKTVHDNVTDLTWQHSPDTSGDGVITYSDKLTLAQAQALPAKLNAANYGGYSDWRLPTIKELYSLINFNGTEPAAGPSGTAPGPDTSGAEPAPGPSSTEPGSGPSGPAPGPGSADATGTVPFIDTNSFAFSYGFTSAGERTIDSQYVSSTLCSGKAADGPGPEVFGVNFADGRIKGYGTPPGSSEKRYFVVCVRRNRNYGKNDFHDNGDKTITDRATGLTWTKDDSKRGMNWEQALAWAQDMNAKKYLGYSDWRLPSAKELQSIVDYSRSPDKTKSAAIDPILSTTAIKNEAGAVDYPYYWMGTTHGASEAAYLAFGRALGYIDGKWQDVHGAGAQRSDPKSGDPTKFPTGRGPQGDAIRINNYVRLVRSGISDN